MIPQASSNKCHGLGSPAQCGRSHVLCPASSSWSLTVLHLLEKGKSKSPAIAGVACAIPCNVPFSFGKNQKKRCLIRCCFRQWQSCIRLARAQRRTCNDSQMAAFYRSHWLPRKNGKCFRSLLQPMPVWPSGAISADPWHLLYSCG